LDIIILFLDNINIKSSRSRYNNKEILKFFSIQKFVLEYIINFNYTFINFKRVRVTIFVTKSIFYIAGIVIIRYIYDAEGRYFKFIKIFKILK